VTVKTPRDDALSSGLVCADLVGTTAPDAVARLRDEYRVVASATPYATRYLRFGPSVANTEDDVHRALEGVASVARA
jgi:selenocysteine lyase/cysteine desulfurase